MRKIWTENKLKKEAKKYSTRTEFQKGSHSAYIVAHRHGLLDQIFESHENHGYSKEKARDGYYNKKKNVIAAAKKCKTKTQFQENFKGAYASAKKNGWFRDATAHMEPQGTWKKRFVYTIRNQKQKIVYVGLTFNPKKRIDGHKEYGRKEVRELLRHNEDQLKIESDPLPIEEAISLEEKLIAQFKYRGWVVLNKAPAGGLGGIERIHTFETCKKLTLTCKSRAAFRKLHSVAAQISDRNGWTDKFFRNRKNKGFTNKKWTDEDLFKLGKACRTRGQFQKEFPSAYTTALSRKLIERIFENHPNLGFKDRPHGFWTFEECVRAARNSKSWKDFYLNYPGAYDKVHAKGWLSRVKAKINRS